MPFIGRPEGFSSETLDLLDRAILQMYRDHLADRELELFAAIARATAAENVTSGAELAHSTDVSSSKPGYQGDAHVASHKYIAGQTVSYDAPKGRLRGAVTYTIEGLMPIENGEVKYRIKSPSERFERIAKESDLFAVPAAA